MENSEIRKMFYEEVRDKKRTATGVFHKKGKGVKHKIGSIKFKSDYLTKKEREKLNGEVVIFNMYDDIITKSKFDMHDIQSQTAMMKRWSELYKIQEIANKMDVHQTTVRNIMDRLGVERSKKVRVPSAKKKDENKDFKPQNNLQNNITIEDFKPTIQAMIQQVIQAIPKEQKQDSQEVINNGIKIDYNGTYNGKSISKILEKIQLLMDDEDSLYKINISITEMTNKD